MVRLLLWLLIIYIGYRIILTLTSGKKKESNPRGTSPEVNVAYRDPVCGMYVSEEDAVIGTLDGQRHYFCSMGCLEKFREQLDHTPRS